MIPFYAQTFSALYSLTKKRLLSSPLPPRRIAGNVHNLPRPLLARLVIPLALFAEKLFVRGSELRPIDLYRQFRELAGELERHLVVLVVHRCAGIGSNVEGFVPLKLHVLFQKLKKIFGRNFWCRLCPGSYHITPPN